MIDMGSYNYLLVLLAAIIAIIFVTFIWIAYSRKTKAEQLLKLSEIEYKKELHKARQDLLATLNRQLGLTIKFIKQGDRFIFTFAEGQLLYKLGLTPEQMIGKEPGDSSRRNCSTTSFKLLPKPGTENRPIMKES